MEVPDLPLSLSSLPIVPLPIMEKLKKVEVEVEIEAPHIIEEILDKSYIAPAGKEQSHNIPVQVPTAVITTATPTPLTPTPTSSNSESEDKSPNEMTISLSTLSLNPLIKLRHDKVMGRCLVAAKDILPGQVFLNDWPLLTAPNAVGPSSSDCSTDFGATLSSISGGVTCLGCCKLIIAPQEPLECELCGWPVCSEQCSRAPQHSDFECKIFAKEGIKPDKLPQPYQLIAKAEYIKILRCLLLKEQDPLKWREIETLEAHLELRRHIPKVKLMSGIVKRFVRDLCKLEDKFDDKIIEFVLGVVDVNAFRHSCEAEPLKKPATKEEGPVRNATFLYPQASMAAHGCIRNTDWRTLPGGQLEMKASILIPRGEVILHAYVDLMLGTPERRRLLHKLFYFDCSCVRCSDKTELGTYFSALKCQKCKEGYLLPDNPLQYNSHWSCTNDDKCQEVETYQYEKELVNKVLQEERNVLEKISFMTNLGAIKELMKVLKRHRGVTLHENHYRVISLEKELVRCLLKVENPPKEIMKECRRLIKKYMSLSSVFHPGGSEVTDH